MPEDKALRPSRRRRLTTSSNTDVAKNKYEAHLLSMERLLVDEDFVTFIYDVLSKLHAYELPACLTDFEQGRMSVAKDICRKIAEVSGGSDLIAKLTKRYYDERTT